MPSKNIYVTIDETRKLVREWDTNTSLKQIREDLKDSISIPFIFLDNEENEISKENEENKKLNDILDGKNLYLKKEKIKRVLLGNKLETKDGLDYYLYPQKLLSSQEKENSVNIMVFGETGVGKSTWIQSLLNYILGIQFEENCRYYLFNEKEQQEKYEKEFGKKGLGCSVTDIPSIYNIDSTDLFKRPIRIIDTAGFGDTRGEEYDEKIIRDILELFEKKDIQNLNAICIIFKATETRAHDRIKSILDKLFSLFSEEIKVNIIIIFTFADSFNIIPAITTLKDQTCSFWKILGNIENLPYYPFNNFAYFSDNKDHYNNIIFEKNNISFRKFLDYISSLNCISLENSKKVIKNRLDIKNNMINLFREIYPKVNSIKYNYKGLSKNISDIEIKISNIPYVSQMEKYYDTVYYNEDVKETKYCSSGYYVLHCKYHDKICHHYCKGYNEGWSSTTYGCNKINTISGNCTECSCHYSSHEFSSYYTETRSVSRSKLVEKWRENPNYAKNEERKRLLEREKNDIYQKRNNINNEFNDCISNGIRILYDMALKNNELNNLALKKDDKQYGFLENVLNKNIKNKYENNIIFNKFINILPDIENVYGNYSSKISICNEMRNNLLYN